jgi:hypothetical protein
MKSIPLSHSAYAFEPDSDEDRIEAITVDRLRGHGLTDEAIRTFLQYRSAWNEPPPAASRPDRPKRS